MRDPPEAPDPVAIAWEILNGSLYQRSSTKLRGVRIYQSEKSRLEIRDEGQVLDFIKPDQVTSAGHLLDLIDRAKDRDVTNTLEENQ